MTVKQHLLRKIKDGSFALYTDEQIAQALRLGRRESFALRDMLDELCREGELLRDTRYRYGTAEQFGAVKGVFTGNERGFGFVTPEEGEDIFIPRRAVGSALHKDLVLAFRTGRGDEGEVLAVLARGCTELVGVYRRDGKAGYLRPDDRRYCAEVLIPAGRNARCPEGGKAVAKLISPLLDRQPTGEIVEVLGTEGDLFTEELALIRAHSLREEFPLDVSEEAESAARRPISPAGREDLRGALIITVDGEDTRDIDDAISLEKREGKFYLGVHIADVSAYVARGSRLDEEAYLRGTSVYFPDRVLPMLPRALSNGACSLNEGEDRLALSCLMTVDGKGKVLKKRIVPSIIRSRHRMTYREVTGIAEGEESLLARYPDLTEFVQNAVELTRILKAAREKKGGVALDAREAKIVYADGKIEIPEAPQTVSQEMIEQFMVLANESVASAMREKGVPFLYRIHEPPSEDKVQELLAFLAQTGVQANLDPQNVSPADYLRILRSVEHSPLSPLVSRVMLRSMMKARYSGENKGHFGLASDCYCHFTSPIRRYPDLYDHRIIKECLAGESGLQERYGEKTEGAAKHTSACERNATDAERDVDALYIAFYMRDKIGEEYDAVISGVTSFGLYAELANTVEGFIPVETLPDDSYEFSPAGKALRGTKNVYRLGERVRVRVSGVDIGSRRTQFVMI